MENRLHKGVTSPPSQGNFFLNIHRTVVFVSSSQSKMGCSIWEMQYIFTNIPFLPCTTVGCQWAVLTYNLGLLWMDYVSVATRVGFCYGNHKLQFFWVFCYHQNIICTCGTPYIYISYSFSEAVHAEFYHESINIHHVESCRYYTSLSDTLEDLETVTKNTLPFDFCNKTRI